MKQPGRGMYHPSNTMGGPTIGTDLFEHGVKFGGGSGGWSGGSDTGMSTTTSISPNIKIKNIQLGTKFSGKSYRDFIPAPVSPFQPVDTQTSLTGKYKLSTGGGRHGYGTGFKGSLSADVGLRDLYHKQAPDKGKLTYGGKISAGIGNKDWNIKAFGEHTSKHHLEGEGTRFGIGGKWKGIEGDVSYNISTKKPEFKLSFGI